MHGICGININSYQLLPLWKNWLGEVRVLLQTKIGVLVEKCPILNWSPSFI